MKENLEQIFISEISPYKDSKFLLAVSGGVDSMVLANLFLSNKLYLLFIIYYSLVCYLVVIYHGSWIMVIIGI